MRYAPYLLLACCAALAGCGTQYDKTAPDKKSPAKKVAEKKPQIVTIQEILDSIPVELLRNDGRWSDLDLQDANAHLKKWVKGKAGLIELNVLRISTRFGRLYVDGDVISHKEGTQLKFRSKNLEVCVPLILSAEFPLNLQPKFQKVMAGQTIVYAKLFDRAFISTHKVTVTYKYELDTLIKIKQ